MGFTQSRQDYARFYANGVGTPDGGKKSKNTLAEANSELRYMCQKTAYGIGLLRRLSALKRQMRRDGLVLGSAFNTTAIFQKHDAYMAKYR